MEAIPATQLWIGRALSGLVIVFLFVDAAGKLFRAGPVMEGAVRLGYPADTVFTMGVLLLIGAILYTLPRTAVIGAIYLTGFLGGALATHFRVGSPLFTHVLFSVYVAALMWGGLVLRNPRLTTVLLGG
jgi:hypothetical protein